MWWGIQVQEFVLFAIIRQALSANSPTVYPTVMTRSFRYMGMYTWIVPAGVTSIQATLQGGSGGSGSSWTGGFGAIGSATLRVTPGSIFSITVGAQGITCESGSICGGYNGGGFGKPSSAEFCGGGGSTVIRSANNVLSSILVVAGGGGGAGSASPPGSCCGGNGGNGGDPDGEGTSGYWYNGGTQTMGGVVYCPSTTCCSGSFGLGGNAVNSSCGGGGGGGYYGGGAGWNNGGGGGGSSYCNETVCSSLVYSIATVRGGGMVNITYTYKPTYLPTTAPTFHPTTAPTPTFRPTETPTYRPRAKPTITPTTKRPTMVPTQSPTESPSCPPTCGPTILPTTAPTTIPTFTPTFIPTIVPTKPPTMVPLQSPTCTPTYEPTQKPSMFPSSRPSKKPSKQPSTQPTAQPSSIPTQQPRSRPSSQPSKQPSVRPSLQPSSRPSEPSSQPTFQPLKVPSTQPRKVPSWQPSSQPYMQPSLLPSQQPTPQPSAQPYSIPSWQPSEQPTLQPTKKPSEGPSQQPSKLPSIEPSLQPRRRPSSPPSVIPSVQPSEQPFTGPTAQPSPAPSQQLSTSPSSQPSIQPSLQSSIQPSCQPFMQPSRIPLLEPTTQPASQPTMQPSSLPSQQPNSKPSRQPTFLPTVQPTKLPTTQPTRKPSPQPSDVPSWLPSAQPMTRPSSQPSKPSAQPTHQPTFQPRQHPSFQPSFRPSMQPNSVPTGQPTTGPTFQPSSPPSPQPTCKPFSQPSNHPTMHPSAQPMKRPSLQPLWRPSSQPSRFPSVQPSKQPYSTPSRQPTTSPTLKPSSQPTSQPRTKPSTQPSKQPSLRPSAQPWNTPSRQPRWRPSSQPSRVPSSQPSMLPTRSPSIQPRKLPSMQPTKQPLRRPTRQPSDLPSTQPSAQPLEQPSQQPTKQPILKQPSRQPSAQPWKRPSKQPHRQPSSQPSVKPRNRPSHQPSKHPMKQPSKQPLQCPSQQPTKQPISCPTISPSIPPTERPSLQPRGSPSRQPTSQPSLQPNKIPSEHPSKQPSSSPFSNPSVLPSKQPNQRPSCRPSNEPTQPTSRPTRQPSRQPSLQPVSYPFSPAQLLNTQSPVKVVPMEAASITSRNDLRYFNINSQLTLSGTIFYHRQCTTAWMSQNSSIIITTAPNSLSSGIKTVMAMQWTTVTLVLKASVLGSREAYQFYLRCGNLSSSVVVIVNIPPRSGSMEVSPSAGYEVQTPFLFKALDWKDKDLPLSYQFSYFTAQNYQLSIGSVSEYSESATALLPAGSTSARYAINGSVQVFDFYAASTASSTDVVVRPVSRAASQKFIISTMYESSNGLSLGTVNLLGSLLNKVNCSGSPNCAKLYRNPCSIVDRTCGSCLSGYIGESDSRNSPCVRSDSVMTRNHSLSSPRKQCMNYCSSRGECVYVDTNNGRKLSSCEVLSATCQAVCSCRIGFAGSSCSYTPAELQQTQKIRETLFTSILNLTQHSSSAASTSALAASLFAQTISIDVNAITYESSVSILSIVNLLISYAAQFQIDQQEVLSQQILTSLNAATSSHSVGLLVRTLENYILYSSSQLYPFQDSVENIFPNFRTIVSALSSSYIAVPLSPLESLTGVAASAVDVSEMFLGDFLSIQATRIGIVELQASLFARNGSYLSHPLIITHSIVRSQNVSASPNQRRFITVALVHYTPADLQTHVVNFSTVCHRRQNSATTSQHRYVCPSSGYVIVHDCANKVGVLTSSCPRYQPSCGSLTGVNHSSCQLVSFSMNRTVCNCSLSEEFSGRRRRLDSNIVESTAIQIVATGYYLVNQVAETLSASPSLASTYAVEHVYIVISIFSSLWTMGIVLLLVGRWAKARKGRFKKENVSTVNPNSENIQGDVAAYISEVVPVIFREEVNSWKTFFDVIRHHRYVSLLNAEKMDSLLVGRVVTVQSMLMFILAVTYDLQFPDDDGTCVNWLSKQDCLSRKSYLDSSQSYCQWSMLITDDFGSSMSGYFCSYQDPSHTIREVLVISVLVSLLTALFLRPVEYLFKVLSAPTANRIKVKPSSLPDKKQSGGSSSESTLLTKLVKNHHVSKVAGVKVRDISLSTIAARSVASKSVHRLTQIGVHGMKEPEDPYGAVIPTTPHSFSRARRQSKVDRGFLLTDASFSKATLEVHLVTSIGRCRRLLPSDMLDDFDSQWGIQRNSEAILSRTQSSDLSEVLFVAGMFDKIYRSVESVRRRAASKIDILRVTTEEQKGLEIFHLFIVDILGRDSPAAKIFESKLGEDFEETKVVKYNRKAAAAAVLVTMNILFAYYSILYGSIRGQSWQMIYLSACLAQFFIEIFINESLETLWLHYVVPMMAAKEVVAAHRVLVDLVESFCQSYSQRSSGLSTGGAFNAPEYLFVSTNVARAFPLLMESLIVQSYASPLPGESVRQWHQTWWQRFWSRVQTPRRGNILVRSAAIALLTAFALLEYGVTAPYLLQKMFVRSCQPFLLSGIVLAFYLVIESPLYITLFFVSAAVLGVYSNRRGLEMLLAKRLLVVMPLPPSSLTGDPIESVPPPPIREISEEEFSINFSLSSESLSLKEESSRSSSVISPLNTSEEGSFYSSLPNSSMRTSEEDVLMSLPSTLLESDNEQGRGGEESYDNDIDSEDDGEEH